MPTVDIPKEAVQGFNSIGKLSPENINAIIRFLEEIKVSYDINEILNKFHEFLKTELKLDNSVHIVRTIIGFVSLLQKDSYSNISKDLVDSYKELYVPNLTDHEYGSLSKNLELILKSSSNLCTSIKSQELLIENSRIFRGSRIISDIRLIFEKELIGINRKGVLFHNLHITYRRDGKNKNFFVSLDFKDLTTLRDQLNRAIEKDKIIRNDYKNIDLL